MNENRLFVQSGHNRLLLFLLSFEKRRKQVQISWMVASLFRVAPECRDMGGLACPYRGALSWEAYLSRR
jgi:hypothetical protein